MKGSIFGWRSLLLRLPNSFSLFETFIEAFGLVLVSAVRGVTEEFVLVSLRNVSAYF